MLKEGVKGTQEIMVTEENTAKVMGSGALDVFATPAMIALMEKTAWESVQPYLEEGSGTVGTLMNVKHVAASPVGMKITCETELTKVDGRALTFSVKAFDEAGLTAPEFLVAIPEIFVTISILDALEFCSVR